MSFFKKKLKVLIYYQYTSYRKHTHKKRKWVYLIYSNNMLKHFFYYMYFICTKIC
jgi:hypothetical protein